MNFAASAQDLSLSAIYEKRRGAAGVALGSSPPLPPFPHPPAAQALPNLVTTSTGPYIRSAPPTLRPATAPLRPAIAPVAQVPPAREMPAALATPDFGFAPTAAVTETPAAPATELAPAKAPAFTLPFDPFRIIDSLWRHAPVSLCVGLMLGVPLYLLARLKVDPHYVASAQIIRTDPPNTFRASASGESFKPSSITVPVLVNMMRASALLDRVSTATKPTVPIANIVAGLVITPERNTDLVRVAWTSSASAEQAVATLNTYINELVNYTKELQSRDAADINTYLKREIDRVEKDHLAVNEELLRYAREAEVVDIDKEINSSLSELANYNLKYESLRLDFETLDIRIQANERELSKASPLAGKLRTAQDELAALRLRYTDANPLVQEAVEKEARLREQIAQQQPHTDTPPLPGESSIAESLYLELVSLRSQKDILTQQLEKTDLVRQEVRARLNLLPRKSMEYALIKARLDSLVAARTVLASRQREAQLFEENALGSCRTIASAREEDVIIDTRHEKMLLAGGGGLGLGLAIALAFFLWRDLRASDLLSAGDLKRLTHLPVLAALPSSLRGDAAGQQRWAFRTWTRILPQLHPSPASGAFICGLVSDASRPGQSHLISLLAQAAVQRGASVLCISAHPPASCPSVLDLAEALACPPADADSWLAAGTGIGYLTPGVDWHWTLAQQDQLITALQHWTQHTSAIIFVELPPADNPVTLRLAERLPKLLWIATSQASSAEAITQPMANYRHAGCQLVGGLIHAVPTLRPAFLNQLAGHAALLCLGLCTQPLLAGSAASAGGTHIRRAPQLGHLGERPWPALASEVTPAPVVVANQLPAQPIPTQLPGEAPPPAFVPPAPSATDYRLGPGDSVSIQLYGQPDSARSNLHLGVDGTLTYLQAQNFPANGLTIDELRVRLAAELGRFYSNPRLMITPVTFQSCKIYILGKVVKKGAIALDRPLTVLEAVAQAGGLETGVFQQNTVELADLGRSFLMRGQKKASIDFERLFYKGDMTQNLPLENGDYLYFPSANSNEIYVIGEVGSQGAQGIVSNTTVTSAITQAGGFGSKAYRSRVLIIRGSLEKPQTLICDMADVLSGRATSLRLEPKDIVYVARHPWARAEELLETALTAFVNGAVGGWTAANLQPLLRNALLPSIPSTATTNSSSTSTPTTAQ